MMPMFYATVITDVFHVAITYLFVAVWDMRMGGAAFGARRSRGAHPHDLS